MIRLHLRCLALISLVACALAAGVSRFPVPRRVATEDRNADGRPDVWHRFVERSEQTEVDIDTNFDGRPDIQEYYDHGSLVRRESDRNFDDQVDLVEEFDASTAQHVRSVVDVDYDGTADLLVLFEDGRPVFSKYDGPAARRTAAVPVQASRSPRGRRLSPLRDPFRADTAVRATRVASGSGARAILSTVDGLPLPGISAAAPAVGTALTSCCSRVPVLTDLATASPRGPPLA